MRAHPYQSQKTLRTSVEFSGKGLHSGRIVKMTVKSADVGVGISFVRTDIHPIQVIPARSNQILDTKLCTRIGAHLEESIGTIEHLMAAFAGLGISNATVMINGPEVPIMDGSSKVFVDEFMRVGLLVQNAPLRTYRLRKSVKIFDGKGGFLEAEPSNRTEYSVSIDFEHEVIGQQEIKHVQKELSFLKLANARTFCKLSEVAYLQSIGLAQGGSLENAIVVSEAGILNEGGLRYADEFVRHKLLDCIGDLALLGAPLMAKVSTFKGGHSLHAKFMNFIVDHFAEYIEVIEMSGYPMLSDEIQESLMSEAPSFAVFA